MISDERRDSQSEGSSLAFDLGSSDTLTMKNHGGHYGSFIFDAVTAFSRTVSRPQCIVEYICSPQYKDRNVRNAAYISVQLGLEEAITIKLSGRHIDKEQSVKFAIVVGHTVTVTVIVGCFWDVRVIPSTH